MAAPIEFTVNVRGLAGLEQRLRDETKKVAIKTLRNAGREAGKVWKEAVSQGAPRDTGFLSEHIKIASVTTSGDDGKMHIMVGPSKTIYPRHGADVVVKKGHKSRASGSGWTKGASEVAMMTEFGTRFQSARPFMRPAFEGTKNEVLDTFVRELRSNLDDLREK